MSARTPRSSSRGRFGGGFGIIGGVIEAAATGATGSFHDLGLLPTGVEVVGFWVWIVATSVVLWRHVPPREGKLTETASLASQHQER